MEMFVKIRTLVVVVAITIFFLTKQSEAQGCVAQSVVNLTVNTHHNLTWSLRPDEPCEVSNYFVYIFHPDQPAEYAFTVRETSVDVSFLEVCEEWIFAVVPVSGNTMGRERRITDKIPLPVDADLSISSITVFRDPYLLNTYLQWNLTDTTLGRNCSLRYRVTLEVGGSPIIEDIYVDQQFINLHFLPPCTNHQVGVRAINIALPTIEGPLKSESIELSGRRQQPPVLIDHQEGTTWANLSFRLESIVRNPCPVKQLLVDVEHSNSYVIDLDNEGERLPVNVSLTNLKPQTIYPLKVYVSNAIGWSEAGEYEIRTLPLTVN